MPPLHYVQERLIPSLSAQKDIKKDRRALSAVRPANLILKLCN